MKVVYGGQLRLTSDKRLTSFTQIYPIGQASFISEGLSYFFKLFFRKRRIFKTCVEYKNISG
jgi:hypothetical protein